MSTSGIFAAGISSSSFAAILGGVRGQFQAIVLEKVFESAEVLDENLAAGVDALGTEAARVTEAGLASARHDLIGTLIDAVG